VVKNAVDGHGRANLGGLLIGAGKAKISEHVARAGDYIKFALALGLGHVAPGAVSVSRFGIENFEVAVRGGLGQLFV